MATPTRPNPSPRRSWTARRRKPSRTSPSSPSRRPAKSSDPRSGGKNHLNAEMRQVFVGQTYKRIKKLLAIKHGKKEIEVDDHEETLELSMWKAALFALKPRISQLTALVREKEEIDKRLRDKVMIIDRCDLGKYFSKDQLFPALLPFPFL